MKTLRDPNHRLANGLTRIRTEFAVPDGFAPEVRAAAQEAARRTPDAHADWTGKAFVTLDPASSTDLDQAFAIEAAGPDIVLHYAIADVAWFVRADDPLDREAWERGTTTYLPDGKAGLYPSVLSENAASLLPGGPRPAIVLTVRVAPDGTARLDAVTRALIRNRAKLAYETVRADDLPAGFADLDSRLSHAEKERGAARVDPPEQQLEHDGEGGFALSFRPWSLAEEQNASLSLAANIAVAKAMLDAGTGLFRTMDEPDADAIAELRRTAAAFNLAWPEDVPLGTFERGLDPADSRHAAMMLAIRRAGHGASYRSYEPGLRPWHAALAAPYAHCTAPLRRLADRYVLQYALAIANGDPVPDAVAEALPRLPRVMARAAQRDGRIDSAVFDLAEAVMLEGCEGQRFAAVVTDLRGDRATIQLRDRPVIARIETGAVMPGERLDVELVEADPATRTLRFSPAP